MYNLMVLYERDITRNRIRIGIEKARESGVRLGRPPLEQTIEDTVLKLRESGLSYPKIADATGVSHTTAWRICKSKTKTQS
jgi:DNA invertase Pin-like site-specific DNA recombinase